MHVNHILLFSAAELWDGLTKTWQMDQSGLQSPSEECVVVKTAFFLTKSLCFHIQNLYVTLPAQIWHYSPCPAVLLSCLNMFPSFSVCSELNICILSTRLTCICQSFGKCKADAKWFTLTPNVLHLLCVNGPCHFIFCRDFSVFRFHLWHRSLLIFMFLASAACHRLTDIFDLIKLERPGDIKHPGWPEIDLGDVTHI